MAATLLIALGLASIVFLSAVLLTLALVLRGQWGMLSQQRKRQRPR